MATEWTAYLSDGRSINEKDLFVLNDLSPFRKLIKYIVKNDLSINAITITVGGVRYNSPSLSEKSNFTSTVLPEKFWISYRERFLPFTNSGSSFIGLSWKVGENRTTLWIRTNQDGQKPISWFEIRPADQAIDKLVDKCYNGDDHK